MALEVTLDWDSASIRSSSSRMFPAGIVGVVLLLTLVVAEHGGRDPGVVAIVYCILDLFLVGCPFWVLLFFLGFSCGCAAAVHVATSNSHMA